MRRLGDIFLTQRAFVIGWSLVPAAILAWVFPVLYPFVQIALLLLVLAVAADLFLLFGRRSGMDGERRTLERWSNGDENPVSLILRSGYGIPVHLRVLDELPFQFQRRDLAFRGDADAWGTRTFDYTVRPVTRGVYRYGAMRVFASTRIGLVERRFSLDRAKEVAVYPSYLHLRRYELLAISDRLTLAGIKRIRRIAQHAEFERIKEYVPGDDRRTVNWKATARRGRLMVNQYQDERAQQVIGLIDTGRVMKMPFEGLTLLDRAINAALVMASVAMTKEDRAGLITFSNTVHDVLPPKRDRGHLRTIMEVLYGQATDHKETDIEALYATVRRQVDQRSLLLLFTNFESRVGLERQLPYLRRLARRHLVVPIFFLNTELEQDLHERPTDTEKVYIRTVTERMVQEKRAMARELELHGMPAVLCRPQDLSVSVLNRYLEIKARGLL